MKKSKNLTKTLLISGIFAASLTCLATAGAFTYAAYESSQTIKNGESLLSITSNGRKDQTIVFYVEVNASEWYYGSGARSDIVVSFFCTSDSSYCDVLTACGSSQNKFTITCKIDYFKAKYNRVTVRRKQPFTGTLWNKTSEIDLYGQGESFDVTKTLYLTIPNNNKDNLNEYTLTKSWAASS